MSDSGTTGERPLEDRKPILSLVIATIVILAIVVGTVWLFFDLMEGFVALTSMHDPVNPQ